jgi:hypothetical protein
MIGSNLIVVLASAVKTSLGMKDQLLYRSDCCTYVYSARGRRQRLD